MEHSHDHGMGGMNMNMTMTMTMAPPPSSSSSSMNMTMPPRHHMMMHMTFYWGTNAEILFSGWPGSRPGGGMYALSLIVVFLLAVIIEWLSRSRLIKPTANDVVSGLIRTFLHTLRMGLAYLVMLAVMSFNGGVFIVAIAGHALGFLVFGTRVFGLGPKDSHLHPYEKTSDLPPMSC